MNHMRLSERFSFDLIGDIDSGFTPLEIQYLRDLFETRKDLVIKGRTGGSVPIQNLEIRDSEVLFLDHLEQTEIQWLNTKLINLINFVNDGFFKFDLQFLESIQLTKYDESYKGFYCQHMDTDTILEHTCRKLSFVIQLSDLDEFEGGEFYYMNKNETEAHPSFFKKGKSVFFPSCISHEVKPVTKGTRYTLVGWVCGPRWK